MILDVYIALVCVVCLLLLGVAVILIDLPGL